jgi:hypothetical protein
MSRPSKKCPLLSIGSSGPDNSVESLLRVEAPVIECLTLRLGSISIFLMVFLDFIVPISHF